MQLVMVARKSIDVKVVLQSVVYTYVTWKSVKKKIRCVVNTTLVEKFQVERRELR